MARLHVLTCRSSLTVKGQSRLADHRPGVPAEVWDEAADHCDEPAFAALIISIANINVWNRLNVTSRQVAGSVPR